MKFIKYLLLKLRQEQLKAEKENSNKKVKKEFYIEMNKIRNKIFICSNTTIH